MKLGLLAFVLISSFGYALPVERTPWKIVEGDCVSEVVRQGGRLDSYTNPLQLTRGEDPLLATVTAQYVSHRGGRNYYELKVYRANSKKVAYTLPLTFGLVRPKLHAFHSELPASNEEREAALLVSMNAEILLLIKPLEGEVLSQKIDESENIVSIIAHPMDEGKYIVAGYKSTRTREPATWFTYLVDHRLKFREHSKGILLGDHPTGFVKGKKIWVAGIVTANNSWDRLQIFSVNEARVESSIDLGGERCALSVFYLGEQPRVAVSCFTEPLIVFDPLEGKELFRVSKKSLGAKEMWQETRYPTPSFTHDGNTYLLAIARSSVSRGGIAIVNAKTGMISKLRIASVPYSGRAWVLKGLGDPLILVQDDNYKIHVFDRKLELHGSIAWDHEVTLKDEATSLFFHFVSNEAKK